MPRISRWLVTVMVALASALALGACTDDGEGTQSTTGGDAGGDSGGDAGGDSGGDAGGEGDGGGDSGGGGEGGGGGESGGGGAGIPDDESGSEAPGAPINIPDVTLELGDLELTVGRFEAELTRECGGTLCVDIVVEHSADGFTECTYVRSEPPEGGQIERGGTLIVIAGTLPCGDPQDPGNDSDESPDSGEESDDDSGDANDDGGDGSGESTGDGSGGSTGDTGGGPGGSTDDTGGGSDTGESP